MKGLYRWLLAGVMAGSACSVLAQQTLTGEIRTQVDVLTSVLMEGLELNNTPNLFGINSGRINSVYLQGQGVVLEIQSPLANQRTRANLNALAFSLRDLPGGRNPIEFAARSQTSVASAEIAASADQAAPSGFYREIINELEALDFETILADSIQIAGSSARSLLELGAVSQNDFESLRNEIDDLSGRVEGAIEQAASMRQRIMADGATLSPQAQVEVRENLGTMTQAFNELSSLARDKATELELRYRSAQEQYRSRWQDQVQQFEQRIYQLLCDYGSTLRALPDTEFITVVLNNLGDETSDDSLLDKIHIISKADLLACQAGNVDPSGLRQRARVYSY